MSEPTPFFLNSQSAKDYAVNPVYHKWSQHIEIEFHWVREHVDTDGEFMAAQLFDVRTGDQTADIFTKALTVVISFKHSVGVLERGGRHLLRLFKIICVTDVERLKLFYPFCFFPILLSGSVELYTFSYCYEMTILYCRDNANNVCCPSGDKT